MSSRTDALTITSKDYEYEGCVSGSGSLTCVVVLTATSDSLTDTITVTVPLTDANEVSPVFSYVSTASASVAEGATTVATYAATDADGSSAVY